MDRQERKAYNRADGITRQIVDILLRWDNSGIVNLTQLIQIVSQVAVGSLDKLTIITFSCLGSYKGKEELRSDLFETYFLRSKKFRRAQEMVNELRALIPVEVLVFITDQEPLRTWGWSSMDSDEARMWCEMMIEEGEDRIPEGWKVVVWSEIEDDLRVDIQDRLSVLKQTMRDSQVAIHRNKQYLDQHSVIHFPRGTRYTSQQEVAAYAWEGVVLEIVLPDAILMQSEMPAELKDSIYQSLRNEALPIIHPFRNS